MNTQFFKMIRAGMVAALPLMGTEFEFPDIKVNGQPLKIKGVPDRHSRGIKVHDSTGMNFEDGGSVIFQVSDFPSGFDAKDLSGNHVKDLRDGAVRRVGEEVSSDGISVEVRLVKL